MRKAAANCSSRRAPGFSRRGYMTLAGAAVLLLAAPLAGHALEERRENCVRLKETQIVGPICKGFVQNDCAHPVDLSVVHEVALRRLVIHPIVAEGPASDYEDAGTARSQADHRLESGDSRWFVHRSPGEGIEVARCKVKFKYTYKE